MLGFSFFGLLLGSWAVGYVPAMKKIVRKRIASGKWDLRFYGMVWNKKQFGFVRGYSKAEKETAIATLAYHNIITVRDVITYEITRDATPLMTHVDAYYKGKYDKQITLFKPANIESLGKVTQPVRDLYGKTKATSQLKTQQAERTEHKKRIVAFSEPDAPVWVGEGEIPAVRRDRPAGNRAYRMMLEADLTAALSEVADFPEKLLMTPERMDNFYMEWQATMGKKGSAIVCAPDLRTIPESDLSVRNTAVATPGVADNSGVPGSVLNGHGMGTAEEAKLLALARSHRETRDIKDKNTSYV
jgi:hypothetical protein